MPAEIRVPSMGESVVEATVGTWLKNEGDAVSRGEPVVELETDKANVEISADANGVLERIVKRPGETVKIGDVLGTVGERPTGRAAAPPPETPGRAPEAPAEPEQAARTGDGARADGRSAKEPAAEERETAEAGAADATPVARRLAEERGVDLAKVEGTGRGRKITREDVEEYLAHVAPSGPVGTAPPAPSAEAQQVGLLERREERVRLSRRRLTIARRLLEAQQTAVMTTTFNEIDMMNVMDLRKRRREAFKQRFGIDLGFMSFFVKATIGALKAYPRLNSQLVAEELVIKHYYDIGIAVASEEGLVVPVLRDADSKTFAEIEESIAGMAERTKDRKLTLEDLQGGTFTITNGGVFGSLMSTPILNPPQVGILGMHRAFERPVVVEGKLEVRPMMYVALTYDHRVVDGSDAVRFLVRVKELVEDPARLLLEG